MSMDTRRRILGVSAVVFLLIAGALWLWQPNTGVDPGLFSFFSRMGAILAAAWLAFDDLLRLPGWLLATLPVVVIVLARWPRLLLLVIPFLVAWVILQRALSPRQR